MANINEMNKKIDESKRIIKAEKKKIRKIRKDRNKKSRLGKLWKKIKKFFGYDNNNYSFSQVFTITIVSLILGFFVCFSLFTAVFGIGKLKLFRQLDKFYDVYEVLVDNYYGEVDKNDLIESAISGMVSSVGDVYTNYNDSVGAESFDQLVSGTYEGIGCLIQQKDKVVSIIEIYDDSPAASVGLKVGDIIKTVDDLDASEVGSTKLSEYIKYDAKGEMKITVTRDNEEKSFTIKRNKVEIPMVNGSIIEKDKKKVGYIRIEMFSSVADKQFAKELTKLEKDGIDSLIIDVRGNNGGYLSVVTDILNKLFKKGDILYQVEKDGKKTVTKDKSNEKRTYPIAVLVDSGSASASEILAGAIKETYKGYVVGVKTYGKGTVQQVKKLKDGSMIKYTTQNWLTPDGNWINEKGIEPTNEVILSEEYLKNPSNETDNQLQEAINLLIK